MNRSRLHADLAIHSQRVRFACPPMSMSMKVAAVALTAALLLAGCGSTGDTGGGNAFSRPQAHVSFEQHHQKEAKRLGAEGELAEAAFHWEVLTVMRPDVAEYGDKLARTRAEIERRATELLRTARQAQQKGLLEEAQQRYLALLALQPDEKSAAQGLRAIERERVKRDQLGKYSARQFLQPRTPAGIRKPPAGSAPSSMGVGGITAPLPALTSKP